MHDMLTLIDTYRFSLGGVISLEIPGASQAEREGKTKKLLKTTEKNDHCASNPARNADPPKRVYSLVYTNLFR